MNQYSITDIFRMYILITIIVLCLMPAYSSAQSSPDLHMILTTGQHISRITDMVYDPANHTVYTCGMDKVIYAWNPTDGSLFGEYRGVIDDGLLGTYTGLALHPNSNQLAVTGYFVYDRGYQSSIRTLSPIEGRFSGDFPGSRSPFTFLGYSMDGVSLLTGNEDHVVSIWDANYRYESYRFDRHHAPVIGVQMIGDSLASISRDGAILLWDTNDPMNIHERRLASSVETFAYDPQQTCFYVTHSGILYRYRWSTDTIDSLTLFNTRTELLALSPSGRRLFLYSPAGDDFPNFISISLSNSSMYVERTSTVEIPNMSKLCALSDTTFVTADSINFRLHYYWQSPSGVQPCLQEETDYSIFTPVKYADHQLVFQSSLFNDATNADSEKFIFNFSSFSLSQITQLGTGSTGIHGLPQLAMEFVWSETNLEDQHQHATQIDHIILTLPDDSTRVILPWYSTVRPASAFHNPPGWFLISMHNGDLRLYTPEGQYAAVFKGHSLPVTQLFFDSERNRFITHSNDGITKLWDYPSIPDDYYLAPSRVFRSREWRNFFQQSNVRHQLTQPGLHSWKLFLEALAEEMPDAVPGASSILHSAVPSYDPLFSLYIHTNMDWVAWTPSSLFSSSPEGSRMVSWLRPQQPPRQCDVYSFSQLQHWLYHPWILHEVYRTGRPDYAIMQETGLSLSLQNAFNGAPVLQLELDTTFAGVDSAAFFITVQDTGSGIEELRLFQNGKLTYLRKYSSDTLHNSMDSFRHEACFPLLPGMNRFRAEATSPWQTVSHSVSMNVEGPDIGQNGDLYAIIIGVDDYSNGRLRLVYAVSDAMAMRDLLTNGAYGLYDSIHVSTFLNEEASIYSIGARIDSISEQSKIEDHFLLYFAGHGQTYGEEYRLLTHGADFDLRDSTSEVAVGIPASMLEEWCSTIAANRQLLLLDACHSSTFEGNEIGESYYRNTGELSRQAGISIISATTSAEYAYEIPQLGHGVFTYAVLQALHGQADRAATATVDRVIYLSELNTYLLQTIPALTLRYRGAAQYPVVQQTAQDYPVWIYR